MGSDQVFEQLFGLSQLCEVCERYCGKLKKRFCWILFVKLEKVGYLLVGNYNKDCIDKMRTPLT